LTATREEILRRLGELEARVDQRLAAERALRLGVEKEVESLRESLERMKKELLEEKARADALLSQKNELQRRLDGFADLAKALGQIRGEAVDPEKIREMVREEVAKVAVGLNPTGVSVSESVPYIDLKVSKPLLTLDESTVEGQITVLALHGKLPDTFGFSDVVRALEREYSAHPRRSTIQSALDSLVGKYKTLERRLEGNLLVYSLRGDARLRVKESETREVMEASE
jgi:hypothetical protein